MIRFPHLTCALILTLLSALLSAQGLTFEQLYDDRLEFRSVEWIADLDVVMAGREIHPDGRETAWIYRVDGTGSPQWTNSLQGKGSARFNVVIPLDGERVFAAGTTQTDSLTESQAFLALFNSSGDTIWTRQLPLAGSEIFDARFIPDRGFVLAGRAAAPSGFFDAILIQTNEAGNPTWTRNFGSSAIEQFFGMDTLDDGYILTGSAFNGATDQVYLVKTDTAGATDWVRVFSNGDGDFGFAVTADTAGASYLVGNSVIAEDGQATLLHITADGNFDWQESFGGPGYDVFRDVDRMEDGSLLVCGSYTLSGGEDEALAMMLTGLGDTIWFRPFGGVEDDVFFSACILPDGGFAFVGSRGGAGYFVKTGGDGIVCQPPLGLTAEVSTDQALLRWDGLPGITEFLIEYRPQGLLAFATQTTTNTQILLTGLDQNRSYEWRVSSACSDTLSSDWSGLQQFTTLISSLSDPVSVDFAVWPNPAQDILFLQNQVDQLQLFNSAGQLVRTEVQSNSLELGGLPDGLYLLLLQKERELISRQVLIQSGL